MGGRRKLVGSALVENERKPQRRAFTKKHFPLEDEKFSRSLEPGGREGGKGGRLLKYALAVKVFSPFPPVSHPEEMFNFGGKRVSKTRKR